MKTFAIHSHRGGSGKSVLVANLASALALRGAKVALIDNDLRGPTQYYIWRKPKVKKFINDYFEGEATEEEVVIDITKDLNVKGELKLVVSNPSIEAIKDVMVKTRKWEMKALKRLLKLVKWFGDQGIDYAIIDTPPGLQYSALNAIVASDSVVLVTLPDKVELEGAKNILKEIYDLVKVKVYLVVNKVPATTKEEADEAGMEVKGFLGGGEIVAVIPYFPEVMKYNGEKIMVLDFPHHPYSRAIQDMTEKLISYLQSS